VDETYTDEEATALQNQITAIPNVSTVEFISREAAMQSFVNEYENTSLFAGLDSSVLRHRYAVYVEDIALIAETEQVLNSITGIADVNAHLGIARGFVVARNIVSGVSLVLIAILFIVSIFIMSNTIKLATFERREEIAIMRMVGATNGFIRWPFVFEGLILGLFGSLLAYLAQWGIYRLVSEKIVGSYSMSLITIIPFERVAIPILIVFCVVGFLVGVGGSTMAIRKFLKV